MRCLSEEYVAAVFGYLVGDMLVAEVATEVVVELFFKNGVTAGAVGSFEDRIVALLYLPGEERD